MNRISGALVALLMGVAVMTESSAATDTDHPQRFAIAISGGASMGAYEAGLNWAALKLLRVSEGLRTLGGGRFRSMEVTSAAGASAGGVNTILTGLTWCGRSDAEGGPPNRIDDNAFRDIWLRVDINSLLPPNADSETYLPDDAVFSRKDYFDAAMDLRDQWRKPVFRAGCRVALGVTVTRVEPQRLQVGDIEVKNQRFYIPFELRVKEDGSIGYFFDPADYPELADPAMILMPRLRGDPEFSISDERIIEAAAASSAFPTALGRRRFEYCRLEAISIAAQTQSDQKPSDTDLICPPGYVLDEAEFADGGLFDNLPVGLARTLAESNFRAIRDPFPVTYFYIDPDRVRYDAPEPPDETACASDDPPEACRIMEFSLFTESSLLLGALGTARKFELYREVTSDFWSLNLSQLSYELADILDDYHAGFDCRDELPYFESPLTCAEAIRRTGRLLEIAYDRFKPVITSPYSAEHLSRAGVADKCEQSPQRSITGQGIECRIIVSRFRNELADALMSIIINAKLDNRRLYVSISRSRQSIHNDRALRVSSRGGPITGTLLGNFGGFLDYKFREYDYFVGVYDAVSTVSRNLCSLNYPPEQQPDRYRQCVDLIGEQVYHAMAFDESERARYVFARLAEREFGQDGLFSFAYAPAPPVDRDMQIIHDALEKALEAGEEDEDIDESIFVTENTFFEYLNSENFVPTEPADGIEPLLAEITADPEQWPTELTRRMTARLVYLERQAADLYAEREPNPDLQEKSYTALMGATAHLLQTVTYRYPTFTFSPSTAPEHWAWRYVIPYEFSWDLVEGDMIMTWQPTLAMSENNLLSLRASLGYAGGLFRSSSNKERKNYLGLGLGYIRRTRAGLVTSFGITPTWYHKWSQPEIGSQDTAGADIHVGFLKDRLRVGLGTRDIKNMNDEWFFTFGFTDLPGAIYWLTR
jgi:predicted acylesterase/phospholipase RssA